MLDEHAVAVFQTWRFDPHVPVNILRVPLRYIDGPPHIDDAMRRPPPPGYSKLITIFIPPEKA